MLFYQGLSGVCRKALAPFLGGKGAARPLTYPVSGNVPSGNAPGPYPTIKRGKKLRFACQIGRKILVEVLPEWLFF